MAVIIEGKHTAEFLVSEANGLRGRATGILISGQNLETGSLLGIITASGKYTRHAHGAADGSQTVAGILYDNVDATDGDIAGTVVVVADTVVRESSLTYSAGAGAPEIATANTELAALGIIVR